MAKRKGRKILIKRDKNGMIEYIAIGYKSHEDVRKALKNMVY